jgi:hypothetical protein
VLMINTFGQNKMNCLNSRVIISFQRDGKGKGKAIPLRAWTGPEGSRKLRLPDFKTIDT